MKTEQQWHAEDAQRDGDEALTDIVKTMERQLVEVQRYAARYAEETTNAGRAKVLDWTIHFVSMNRGIRLDLAAKALSKLDRYPTLEETA